MKKLAFIFAWIMIVTVVSAQNSKVQSALNYSKPQYNQLDKAQEAIELAIKHEKTQDKAKTWKVRGQVYQAIANSKDENFQKLSDNPLKVAFESYKKALELDEKGQLKNEISIQLKFIGVLMINKGIDYFNTKEFLKAFDVFESSLAIDEIVDPGKIDTAIIFNAGVAADQGKDFDNAIKYYKKTAELGYEGAKVYGYIANIEKDKGDTVAYVTALKDGISAYPADNTILRVELINYYLNKGMSDLALEYLAKAIEKDPTNHTFYFAQGALYDELKDFENAKASYEKAVEINPEYFDAYYNLGVLYFNKGADMLKEANNIPPNEQKKYDAAVKESFKELEKALPALEKAHALDPTDKPILLTLKEIYFKLRNDKEEYMTKYKEFNEKIKNLPEEK
ncbi:MAG: tetratricopeptide repeat protein [Salinivirgaceae bacterium]|nr:tetratricopeptide repeat protein [Salinivirgaceae bacterium]